ncbi:hypothetical protein AB0D04_12980 [Streptomyces sp. NPDC048483]|uniref:hypothetical protein n=1 Tax=Streptomyces sp. NPDC048483 TaxID=3154927 RepID=UPI003419BF88
MTVRHHVRRQRRFPGARDHAVGQFAIVRNVVAPLAKAVFALAAGSIAGLFGLTAAYAVLAASTALFVSAWFLMRPEEHISAALRSEG